MSTVTAFNNHDDDRVSPADPPWTFVRRHLDGHFTVDPFGLDARLADFVAPAARLAVAVHVAGADNVPASGPAAVVANRGFGVFEPAALAIAVRRATGRRLRIVGAPPVPFVGAVARRLGAIPATQPDVAVALRAGHLVGIPLTPTWLRTGAGTPPHALMRAVTHAPIIPAAVRPAGPFGTSIRGWEVTFGPLVTLPDPYDPDDPLAAARFADEMRASVRTLLEGAQ